MTTRALKEWQKLPESTRKNIFVETAKKMGLPAAAIEKDWWVTRTLELVFGSSLSPFIVFKGGTSLSKAWGLIDRFSEDIDLALDRKFFNITQPDHELTSSQVRKLRRLSSQFVSETYFQEIQATFWQSGFSEVLLEIKEIKSHDEDPVTIEVIYPSLTESNEYLQPKVLIEIGSRSLIEPFDDRSIISFVGTQFKGSPFAEDQIIIPTVNPQRTFWEKILLLHEEFQRPIEQIKVQRKSRHLYDLEKLMDTKFAQDALENIDLFYTIVEHRKILTPIRGINYENHIFAKINPIPPNEIMDDWAKDYREMQQSMLYDLSLPFDKLIERIFELKKRVNLILP
jgi:predicted nucleotidyltransferase component of viral defense system